MLLPAHASLIISAARQLVRLSQRVDNLLAEKTAAQSTLVLGMPTVRINDILEQKAIVREALRDTQKLTPDPFGTDRAILEAELSKNPVTSAFDEAFKKYFPDAATPRLVSPDAAFLAKLKQAFPGLDWKDPATRIAAFALAAGTDNREISYSGRIALAVADTLLEFGAENAASFVRDEKLGGVLTLVLQRLAEPEWDKFEDWSPLLQSVLRGVLNAALDVGEALPAENPWLAGTIDALLAARKKAGSDDFVLGLVRGESFPLLLSEGLLVASKQLGTENANGFEQVAADVLKTGADLIAQGGNGSFQTFFNHHWGDLLRAALTSLDKHGDALLADADPLLSRTLKALVQQLAATPDAQIFSHDTLFNLADTAIGVVADHAADIPALESKPWLRDLVAATAATARQLTAKNLFTPAAAEALIGHALTALASHPKLAAKHPDIPLALIGDLLHAVRAVKRADARQVIATIAPLALASLAQNSALASSHFTPAVIAATRAVAELIATGKISAEKASLVGTAAIEAITRNPDVLGKAQSDSAATIITLISETLRDRDGRRWRERLLVPLARATLLAVARAGAKKLTEKTPAEFRQLLTEVLNGALAVAEKELGTTVDLEGIPHAVGAIVERALRDEIAPFTPEALAKVFRALTTAHP